MLSSEQRVAVFETIAESMEWGPRTQATYFACLLSALKILGVDTTRCEDLKMAKAKKAAMAAPRWDLEDETQILSSERISKLEAIATQLPPVAATSAALLSLYLGQRMGDVIKLRIENIVRLDDRIMITFKEGKTVGVKGPFTIAVTTNSRAGMILTEIAAYMRKHRGTTGRIFAPDAEETFKIQAQSRIDVRALRRTGLIRLGLAGATEEQLLFISRHSTVAMLNLYMNNGMFNLHKLDAVGNLLRNAEEMPMPHIHRLCEVTTPTHM
jgi:integrase